jgi:alcohol dehydrogenase (cytochrome c)
MKQEFHIPQRKFKMKNSVKIVLAFTALALSQLGMAQDRTVKDGVFTAAQVETGKLVYDNSCKNCHDMRFYRDILKSYNNQPVLWLWEAMLGTMPADNPGSLMLDEYTDVIAYILSENGFPAGEDKLDPDNGMDVIKVLSP